MTATQPPATARAWDTGAPARPVAPARWGKDHWSTFAYLETCVVDRDGLVAHERMRCDVRRHPVFAAARPRGLVLTPGGADAAQYPTRLRAERPGPGGVWPVAELADHDDYDCVADMIREGLLEARMPEADREHDVFRDARGVTVRVPGGEPVRPSYVTGMGELVLTTRASFALTDRGRQVAAALRAHLAQGGTYHRFTPPDSRQLALPAEGDPPA